MMMRGPERVTDYRTVDREGVIWLQYLAVAQAELGCSNF